MADYGRLDCLVNTALVVHLGDPENFNLQDWRHMSGSEVIIDNALTVMTAVVS